MATNKKTETKKTATTKATAKTASKSAAKTKTVTKTKPELTEEQVQGMIEDALKPLSAGMDTIQELLKSMTEASLPPQADVPEEVSDEIPEPPLPDLPPIPEDESEAPGEDKSPLEEKPTVEVSPRSLGGVIAEQGIPWNMFLVSVVMALVLGAIFASMYFLNRAIQIAPLEIQVPEELEFQETSRIDTGLKGSALVYAVEEGKPFSWGFKNGVLAIKPQAEGTYSLVVTVTSGRKVCTGYIRFESVTGAGDTRYKALSEEVTTAIESIIPENERSFCKEIGDNYKEVAEAKPDSLEAFGAMIRDRNRDTLGFNDATAKLDNESHWFSLLMNGGPISDLILQYAGVNPSKETLAKISLAISRGFYAVKG